MDVAEFPSVPIAVIVILNVPFCALCIVYNVTVSLTPERELVTGFALQLTDTPAGSEWTVRYTVCIPPVTVATVDVDLPFITLPEAGPRLNETVGA